MLLCRYHNIDYIMDMYWIDGIDLINKAIEKEIEKKDWDLWVSLYPKMDKDNFISFDKFRNIGKTQQKQAEKIKKTDKLTAKEILEKAENTKSVHQKKHKGLAKD